jgi:hypothetical protein
MARSDPPLNVRIPQFVHDDLGRLKEAMVAEAANDTNLVAALVHAAKAAQTRQALGKYRRDEAAYRRAKADSTTQSD